MLLRGRAPSPRPKICCTSAGSLTSTMGWGPRLKRQIPPYCEQQGYSVTVSSQESEDGRSSMLRIVHT